MCPEHLFRTFQFTIKLAATCFIQFTEIVHVGLQRWIWRHRKLHGVFYNMPALIRPCFLKNLIIPISIFPVYFCLSSSTYLEFCFFFPFQLSPFSELISKLFSSEMRIFETWKILGPFPRRVSNSLLTLTHNTKLWLKLNIYCARTIVLLEVWGSHSN